MFKISVDILGYTSQKINDRYVAKKMINQSKLQENHQTNLQECHNK